MSHSILSFLFLFNILIAITALRVAGRNLPPNTDTKQPEFFLGHHEGTVLIPGFGRVVIPDKFHKFHKGSSSFNPFTYNPVTGQNGGARTPTIGGGSTGSGSGGRNYVPGGDDTFVPNPGFEVPNPGSGGNVPTTSGSHH